MVTRSRGRLREARSAYRLFVEGRTEEIYFRELRQYYRIGLEVQRVRNTDPLQIVKLARRWMDAERGNSPVAVWCVFDQEGQHQRETFTHALNLAARHGIRLAVSNPCFEFWFLLHFEHTTRSFADCREVGQSLSRYWANYRKAQPGVISQLADHVHAARGRAGTLRQISAAGAGWANPMTDVDLLVCELLRASRRR
mgnify:CR=1 FL=1